MQEELSIQLQVDSITEALHDLDAEIRVLGPGRGRLRKFRRYVRRLEDLARRLQQLHQHPQQQ